MAGESGTSSTKGVKHYYYKCGGAKRKLGCKRKVVRKHWIERAAVLVTVQRVLQDDEISRIAEAIVALQEKEDTSLPAMRQQLTGCEKAIDNMLNDGTETITLAEIQAAFGSDLTQVAPP